MKENTVKSIISALSGAIMVLLVALMVLMLTKKDKPAERVHVSKPTVKEEVQTVSQSEVVEPSIDEKVSEGDSLNEAFDSFGVLDTREKPPVRETTDNSQKESKEKSEETKLAPLVEVEDSKELAELDSIIEDQQEKLKVPEKETIKDIFEEKPQKQQEPQKTPIARKEVTPEGKNLVKIDSNMEIKSELEAFVLGNANFLNTSADEFNKKWLSRLNGSWTDNIRSSARSVSQLKFANFNSLETVFTFRKARLNKISMMVYNKGDIGYITKKSFNQAKDDVLEKMTALLGKKSLFKPYAGITRNNIHFWVVNGVLYKLEYSAEETSKDFISEYIRVVVSKARPGINVINIDKTDTDVVTEADLRKLVKREDNGDVIINGIPMVDQGKKGYCACAALARLMMYFGRDFDQHDIANLASSTGSEGTDPKSLKKAIETMSAMLRLNMKVLAKCYMSDASSNKTKDKLLDMKENFTDQQMNERVFKDMAYNNRRYKEFEKNVMSSIDRGRPVAWALEVGMVPEKGIMQSSGGHMRIITGYNKGLGVIYYTDTWGAGHEKKTMPMTSAFFVSYAVWEISPR